MFHYFLTAFNVLFQVKKLLNNLELAAGQSAIPVEEPSFFQPLPPSSFQRFLRARPIPGVVIEDHRSEFTNRWLPFIKPNIGGNCMFWIKSNGFFCLLYSGSMRACMTIQSTWMFLTHQTWRKRNSLTFSQTLRRYRYARLYCRNFWSKCVSGHWCASLLQGPAPMGQLQEGFFERLTKAPPLKTTWVGLEFYSDLIG